MVFRALTVPVDRTYAAALLTSRFPSVGRSQTAASARVPASPQCTNAQVSGHAVSDQRLCIGTYDTPFASSGFARHTLEE